jgi:hypothetical protein
VLLLLDIQHGAVLEGPLDDVGVVRGALVDLGLGERRPEVGKVLQLDVVPDVRERGLDDGALDHAGRRRDGGGGGHGSSLKVPDLGWRWRVTKECISPLALKHNRNGLFGV